MEVLEDMNKDIVNLGFYDELGFLGEWFSKPKYDGDGSGYKKVPKNAVEEELDKEETILVVEVIATVED
jgi:hypothetical protein